MPNNVDEYLLDGCMRCKFGATPQCKVHNWKNELLALREIVLSVGLEEHIKWGVPCYTFQGKNVVIVAAFKNFASLSFFKGGLLTDAHQILQKQGENSQEARLFKCTDVAEIYDKKDILQAYLLEAVEIEKSGQKVEVNKKEQPIPEELLEAFQQDNAFREAFYRLTPGRQRGYVIFFSQPKQSVTKTSRIVKCKEQILKGIGLNDKYAC